MNDKNKSKYEIAAEKIGKLVTKKQSQYGDSFGKSNKILNVLYPDGVKSDQYQTLLTVTRIIDKLFRVANGDQGNESAFQDIAGYALLEVAKLPEGAATSAKEFVRAPVTLTFETPTLMMTYNDENGNPKMETIRDFKGSISVMMNVEDDVSIEDASACPDEEDDEDQESVVDLTFTLLSSALEDRNKIPLWKQCGLKDPNIDKVKPWSGNHSHTSGSDAAYIVYSRIDMDRLANQICKKVKTSIQAESLR